MLSMFFFRKVEGEAASSTIGLSVLKIVLQDLILPFCGFGFRLHGMLLLKRGVREKGSAHTLPLRVQVPNSHMLF